MLDTLTLLRDFFLDVFIDLIELILDLLNRVILLELVLDGLKLRGNLDAHLVCDFDFGLFEVELKVPILHSLDPIALPVNVFLELVDELSRLGGQLLDAALPVIFVEVVVFLDGLNDDHKVVLLLIHLAFLDDWGHL